MHQFDGFEAHKVAEILHDEAVAFASGANPCVRFQMNVAVDAVKKLPCVCGIAGVHVLVCQMSGLTKDRPRDARL